MIATLTDRLSALSRMHQSLGYQATLARGYAVVRKGDAVITSAKAARGELEVEFHDGRVTVTADGAEKQGRLL